MSTLSSTNHQKFHVVFPGKPSSRRVSERQRSFILMKPEDLNTAKKWNTVAKVVIVVMLIVAAALIITGSILLAPFTGGLSLGFAASIFVGIGSITALSGTMFATMAFNPSLNHDMKEAKIIRESYDIDHKTHTSFAGKAKAHKMHLGRKPRMKHEISRDRWMTEWDDRTVILKKKVKA